MTSMVDANGRGTTYTFDPLNRQSVIVYETNPTLDELAQLTNSFDAISINAIDVKTWALTIPPGRVRRRPEFWSDGIRHRGGVTIVQALERNFGTCRSDVTGHSTPTLKV
jgi:hypothetical protein